MKKTKTVKAAREDCEASARRAKRTKAATKAAPAKAAKAKPPKRRNRSQTRRALRRAPSPLRVGRTDEQPRDDRRDGGAEAVVEPERQDASPDALCRDHPGDREQGEGCAIRKDRTRQVRGDGQRLSERNDDDGTRQEEAAAEAEAAYENAHLVAQDLLERLRELVIRPTGARRRPRQIHWGHVGDISRVNALLGQAIAFLERKGG